MNRGDRREAIFRDEADRQRFVETLGEVCARSGWQVHAYCLMSNHFHLVVETPQPTLVAGMKWFLGTYTGRFNRRHRMFGHLFSGRYKSLIVDGSGTGYLRTVCEYVHTGARFGRVVSVTVRGDQSALVDDPAATAAHATLGGGIIQSIKGTLLKFPYISVLPTRPGRGSLQFQ